MFAARNSQDHSARKRMISNVYSKSFLQSSQAAKCQTQTILLDRLLPLIQESSSPALFPTGLDVHSLFLATTMDFIAGYVFGLGTGTNFIQDKGYRGHWLELYNARNDHHFWPQELPSLTRFFKRFGVWLYPRWVDDANAELAAWNVDLCRKTTAAASEGAKGTADEPVVFNSLNAGIDRESKTKGANSILYSTVIQQRDLSVQSELFDHVLAGQETAGIALTYLSWHLSKDPDLQLALRRELLTLSPNFKLGQQPPALPDPKHLDSLPLLHAIITETLRLHAPLPGPQARRTPHPSCAINGLYIPGGVRIAALAYTLHRDEKIFPNPGRWDYRRWLPSEATQEQLRERQRQFWAFSSGGRMCIGSHFAMNGTYLSLPPLFTTYRIPKYIVAVETGS
jgi:cytochrome P450